MYFYLFVFLKKLSYFDENNVLFFLEIRSLPVSVINNEPLPLPRVLSTTLFPQSRIDDPVFTLAMVGWSQFIVHDMSLGQGTIPFRKFLQLLFKNALNEINELNQN